MADAQDKPGFDRLIASLETDAADVVVVADFSILDGDQVARILQTGKTIISAATGQRLSGTVQQAEPSSP